MFEPREKHFSSIKIYLHGAFHNNNNTVIIVLGDLKYYTGFPLTR